MPVINNYYNVQPLYYSNPPIIWDSRVKDNSYKINYQKTKPKIVSNNKDLDYIKILVFQIQSNLYITATFGTFKTWSLYRNTVSSNHLIKWSLCTEFLKKSACQIWHENYLEWNQPSKVVEAANNLMKLVEVGKHFTKLVKFANNFMKFVKFANIFTKFVEYANNFTKFVRLADNF